MANEPRDPSQQAEQAAEQTKNAAKNAKDFSAAIDASLGPLQRANNMTKAISDEMAKSLKAIKDSSEAMQQMGAGFANTTQAAASRNEKEQEYLNLLLEAQRYETERSRAYTESYKEQASKTKQRNDAMEAELGYFTKLKKAAEDYMHAATAKGGGTGGLATGMEALTGKSQLTESIGSIGSAVTSLLPSVAGIGGLIGLMVHGRMDQAKFTAVGEIVRQQFDQIGGASKSFGSEMGGLSRTMSRLGMIAEADLAQVAKAFASVGVSAEQAQSKVVGFSAGIGGRHDGSLMLATLSADKALELSAGTLAKMSGVLARDFNVSANAAFTNLRDIGMAAKDAGINTVTFMQSVMEANGALRMLNANMGDVGEMQLKLTKSMIGSGFRGAFSGQYAAAGMQNATQGISSLGVGMSSVMGERLGMGGGLDAWYAMKSPMAESRGRDASGNLRTLSPQDIAAEMGRMVQGMTSKTSEQVYALTQIAGVDVRGAEAILSATKAGTDHQKLTISQQRELNNAFRSEAEKTSSIERHLAEIKDGISHVGNGLLAMIVGTLKMIYQGINVLISAATGGNTGPWLSAMQASERAMGSGTKEMGSGLKELFSGIKGGGSDFGLTSGWSPTAEMYQQSGANSAADSKLKSALKTAAMNPTIFGMAGAAAEYLIPTKNGPMKAHLKIEAPDGSQQYGEGGQ